MASLVHAMDVCTWHEMLTEEEFNGADLTIHRITATPERESDW